MTGDHFMATLCRLDVFLLFTFLNIISNSRLYVNLSCKICIYSYVPYNFCTFAKSFRWQSFRGIKESALLLVKSPNLNKEYTRHGAAHIRGLPIRVVYSGVWRYLQENTEGSPLSLTINIVNPPSWLSEEDSCKIRHYE